MKLKEDIYNFLKKEIGEEKVFSPPPYPGEILLAYSFKEKGPLVLLTEESPLKVAQDAEFFFTKILWSGENLKKLSARIKTKDFEILILEERDLYLEIPQQDFIKLSIGGEFSLSNFQRFLEECGFLRRKRVYEEGEYALRGGIIDIWSPDKESPLRIELEDEKIVSLRLFDPLTQLSIREINEANLLIDKGEVKVLGEVIKEFFKIGRKIEGFDPEILLTPEGKTIPFIPAISFNRNLEHFRKEIRMLKGFRIFIAAGTPGEVSRLHELFDSEFPEIEYLDLFLSKGFVIDKIKIAVFTEGDLFGALRAIRKIKEEEIPVEFDYKGFMRGDYLVHEDFGIGRFGGLEIVEIDKRKRECIVVEYKNKSRILVPIEKSRLLTKYVGGGEKEPELSDLSRSKWEVRKKRIKKELEDYARSLLELYARRSLAKGYSYSKDNSLIRELEFSFPFQETPDQEEAIKDVYEDMAKDRPMDRLLCGEVGFGKTEVALRTAFKAVIESKQAVLLAPTTILAEQHYRTFKERLRNFPVNIELLSRLTKKREKEILENIKTGKCDIVIGTHMLINKKIEFKDLGVLIIDEEQRFGVRQKEKIKEMKINVDVLSMSATPIPRTLQLSLLGLRDLSVIRTPPLGRKKIITEVIYWDENKIRDAILREIERGGQVFFVHNRVESIENVRKKLEGIVPEVKIVVGHGQMEAEVLEKRMIDFLERKYDLLLSTAIIESGLDLPNVNTIIIDKAESFGLADLHQLRGRVGRSFRQGFCYLIVPKGLSGKARDRISTIKTYSDLGSGFKISLKDLEIRGAGEILGEEQHGHIATLGYELYLKLLKEAIRKVKGEEVTERPEVEVILEGAFYIPKDYIPEEEERIELYRRISSALSVEEIDKIESEIKDRFGKMPFNVLKILKWAKIKILAESKGVKKVEEGIKSFNCEMRRELKKEEIERLVSKIEGIKFSFREKVINVSIPRDAIFMFLELCDTVSNSSF
ncbi:MAG: transcription-repair coupling factor [candidate division WOR-3 bacterium]